MYIGSILAFAESDLDEEYIDLENSNIEDIKRLAVLINSAWSGNCETYTIKPLSKELKNKLKVDDDYIYYCEYEVNVYDGVSAYLYGYGHSVASALHDCLDMFIALQYDYNIEGKKI